MGIDVLSFVLGKAASGGNGNGGAVLENLPISLDFTNGNQTITAPDGYLVKSATIEKPSDLIAENIREGKNIAGVVGTMAMPEIVENVPIELDFSNGAQEQQVAAPDGYAVKSIKIQRPADLIPENIAEGAEIAGIVGTHVGGGGGSDDSTEPKYIEDSWATISSRSLAGTAQEYYRVGDFKGIAINNSSGYPEIYLAVIAGFNLHCNTGGKKDGITFIVKGLPNYDTVSSTSDTKIYTAPAVESLLYSKIGYETKNVIRQSVVGNYTVSSNGAEPAEQDTTCRLFCPLLSNISASFVGVDGTNVIKNNTLFYANVFEGTEYESTKDSGVFPLFSDMSKEQIKTFFGITGNKMLTTRTLAHMTAGGGVINGTRMAVIKASEDYVLYKDCSHTGNRYYTFCFRV